MRNPSKVIGDLKLSWCDVVLSRQDKLVIILFSVTPFFIIIEKCNSNLFCILTILEETLRKKNMASLVQN